MADSIRMYFYDKSRDLRSRRATDPDWIISGETLKTAAELCAEICAQRGIPLDHILRHWDATGKPCPRPLVTIPADHNNTADTRRLAFLSVVEDKLAKKGGSDARSEA